MMLKNYTHELEHLTKKNHNSKNASEDLNRLEDLIREKEKDVNTLQ